MANKKENVREYFEMYETMKKAVPEGKSTLEVVRACELIIADCIAQANISKEMEGRTCKTIAEDIRGFIKAFKPIIEEKTKEDDV